MSRFRLVSITAGMVAGASLWLLATSTSPATASSGDASRDDAFRRAAVRVDPVDAAPAESFDDTPLECRFIREEPSGTSAKFSCALGDGQIIKVKYGRNPEIHAEAAATSLLRALGYAADEVTIVPRVRCYGCPRFPFFTMQLLTLTRTTQLLGPHGHNDGYADFEWAGVERKFPAPAIDSETQQGWAWFELARSQAPRADVDALRLLAVFLAHWDNKSSNQRLVCLDQPAPAAGQPCARPLLMIQDLGATFGPEKVNLARWRDMPVWADRRRCIASMRALPFEGATFNDVTISEQGRLQVARQLAALDDARVKQLFVDARFPQFYSGTDDERDLEKWRDAFRSRVAQIVSAGPCT